MSKMPDGNSAAERIFQREQEKLYMSQKQEEIEAQVKKLNWLEAIGNFEDSDNEFFSAMIEENNVTFEFFQFLRNFYNKKKRVNLEDIDELFEQIDRVGISWANEQIGE